MKKILEWVKQNRIESLIFITIILVTLGMRVYRIDEYMTFLGDEGRDALVIKRILTEFDIPLIGPPTSVGNMYLGPFYYYMMTVPMTIFWLNPVAAATMVALVGTLTVGLIYYLSREWFGKRAAISAAILYSLSPVNIIYSRSSWNPNPAPLFAMLGILGLHLYHKTKNGRFLILVGVAAALAIQMHYLALILLPVLAVAWGNELFLLYKTKLPKRSFIQGTVWGILAFLFLMSPLVVFDFRHNFINFRAISTFFSNRETTVNLNAVNATDRILPIYIDDLIKDYTVGDYQWLALVVAILVMIPVVFFLIGLIKGRQFIWPYFILGVWLIIGVLGLSLYKQSIYAHYLGFLNPVPFLLLGGLFYIVKKVRFRIVKIILNVTLGIIILSLAFVSLERSPLKQEPNRQLKRTQDISRFVIEQASGKPFNFALISKHNYDAAYQFYLDVYGHKPKQLPFEKTDQLFVVCEDSECAPVGHPKYEIAAFGWAKIESQRNFQGIKVYKLISNPDEFKND